MRLQVESSLASPSLLLGPDCLQGFALQVACGVAHTVALMADGRVWAWGRGARGCLGTGNLADSTSPQCVPAVTVSAQHVSAGVHWGMDCLVECIVVLALLLCSCVTFSVRCGLCV